MEYRVKKRFLSLVLCICMIVPMLTQALPVFLGAANDTTFVSEQVLNSNVEKQAVFDWWSSFDLANDVNSMPGDVVTVDYDDIDGSNLVVLIQGYYYDETDGSHWYKVAAREGETLPNILSENPWVLYTTDFDIENGTEAYLCIYEEDETIRFVTSETIELEVDEDGNIVKDESGEPVIKNKHYNYYVVSGPAALVDADISITHRDSDYSISDLAYTEPTYGTTFSKAYDITITKSNKELWDSSDGLVSIRYEASQLGSDTYTEDVGFGAGFVYVDGKMYSVASTDRGPYEMSDLVYTNSGKATLVFEHMLSSFEWIGLPGYFLTDTLNMYSNTFETQEYTADSLPGKFNVACTFTYDGIQYYWIEHDELIGSPYFLVNAKCVAFETEKVIDSTATIKSDVTSVTLYADPAGDLTASNNYLADISPEMLPEILSVSSAYFNNETNTLYYKVRAAVGFTWPEAYYDYYYISSDLIQLETDYGIAVPIVNFTNAAPIIEDTNVVPEPQVAMYNTRNLLAANGTRSLTADTPVTVEDDKSTSGLVLNKEVIDNGSDTYTVNLEVYTTGTVTVQQTTKPMDIVLVLDQSGSMAYCIGCGRKITKNNQTHDTYSATYQVRTNGTYYIKNGNSYSQVYYCYGSSRYGCDAGWYTQYHAQHHGGSPISYKTSATSGGTQFYTRTVSGQNCERRYDALVDALDLFIADVRTKARNAGGDPVDHRIAVVGFSSNGYNNTELLTGVTISTPNAEDDNYNTNYYPDGKEHNGVQYGEISDDQYQTALQDMSTDTGYASVTGAVDALTAHGGTQTLHGMDMAYEILDNDSKKNEEGREKVVILFTDGATNSTRSTLLNKAYSIKSTFGATIYTVGIFDGANGSLPSYTDNIDNDNSLMHLISSNYPDAHYSNGLISGDRNPLLSGDDSYYLSASDSSALSEIFKAMSSQIGGTSMDLGSDTVVKDIVTPQFALPSNVTSVTVKQVDCLTYDQNTGMATWGTEQQLDSSKTVKIDPDAHSVDITGFDFKHNYVASTGRLEGDSTKEGTFRGRKLVISFVITPDPDFLGGDGVATNGADSGVYNGEGELVGKFKVPTVNIPLKDITTVVKNKHIYYGNITDLTGLLDLWVKRESNDKPLQVVADGINNAYVDLLYTITLDDNTVAQYKISAGKKWEEGEWILDKGELLKNIQLNEDTDFSISCAMTSSNNHTNVKTAGGKANVFVYEPVLTFKDSEVYYQETIITMSDHRSKTEWKHGDTLSTEVSMEGNEPVLTLTYTYENGAISDNKANVKIDIPVSISVKLKGTGKEDILERNSDYITFLHDDCEHIGCDFDSKEEEFIIHVLLRETSLKICKSGSEVIDANQTFIFHITGDDNVDLYVTVHGNSNTIVEGLSVGGNYTVTEQTGVTGWSWRYSLDSWNFVTDGDTDTSGKDNGASITLGETGNNITFTNKRPIQYWLDGDSWCDNIFK